MFVFEQIIENWYCLVLASFLIVIALISVADDYSWMWGYVFSGRKKAVESSDLPLPPGNMGLPIIGEILQFITQCSTGAFFTSREVKFGPIFKTHILFNPTIYISGPEAVKKVLLGEYSLVENSWPLPMRRLMGPGSLAVSSAEDHKQRRRLVVKCFRRDILDEYLPIVRRIIVEELTNWSRQESDGAAGCSDGAIEVYNSAKMMTIKAAAKVMLGIDDPDLDKIGRYIVEYADGFFAIPLYFPGTAYFKATRAKHRLHMEIRTIIKERIRASQSGDEARPHDVITHILASSGSSAQSVDVVVDQALELLFGGQETLSGLASCIVMFLGQNSDIIDKIHEELDEVGWNKNGCHVDMVMLDRLIYTGYVVKEALRIYPPIGGGYRKVIKSFDLEGYSIPKSWSVTYSIKGTHDRSELFLANKEEFLPERWQNITKNSFHSSEMNFHYLPFGVGARSCIGKEYAQMFIRLFCAEFASVYRRCKITNEPIMLKVPLVRPKNGLWVKLTPRVIQSAC